MSCEQLFREQLKKKGLRLTPQRKLVLQILHDTHGPVAVDTIFQQVRKLDPALDISTVYRTLDLLKEIGLVQQIQSPDRQNYYEHTGTGKPHIHLVCQKCGRIFTADLNLFNQIKESLTAQLGFVPDWSQMTIPGCCDECRTDL